MIGLYSFLDLRIHLSLGVGESLPTLDSSSLSSQQTGTLEDIDDASLEPEADQDDAFAFVTPRKPPRGIRPANFYNGLDSAAGAKLLMSPAIIGRKQCYRPLRYNESSPEKVNPPLF